MIEILLLILATWRLTSLLVWEHGPWDVLGRLRHLAGIRINDVGEPYGTNALAHGLLCLRCVSVWVGVGWAALYYATPDAAFWLALPFALSAGAILFNSLAE